MTKKTKQTLTIGTIVIITLVLSISFLWLLFSTINRTGLQVYAIITTILLPLTAWLFWWLGSTESRGYLKGIDGAITKMFHAITINTNAKTNKPTNTQPTTPSLQQQYLPQIHIKSNDTNKIIDL